MRKQRNSLPQEIKVVTEIIILRNHSKEADVLFVEIFSRNLENFRYDNIKGCTKAFQNQSESEKHPSHRR